MRKRKTQAVKRPTTRSIHNVVKLVHAASMSSDPLDKDEEGYRMEQQECLQRQVDNFWGIDKDLKDRNQEITLMAAEDALSRHVERDIKILAQQKVWDMEYQIEERYRIQREKELRAHSRVDHLRLVNSPLSVEDLLRSVWNLQPDHPLPILPQIASLNMATNSVANLADPSADQSMTLSNVNNLESLQDSIASLGSMRMSLHLEGLQQTREIINQASSEFRSMLKDVRVGFNSQETVSVQPSSSSDDPSPTRKKRGALASIQQASKVLQIGSKIQKEKERKARIESLYNDAVEGHGTLHWDQEQMLHQTFLLMDRGNKGYLTKEELSAVSFNPQVHGLLRYTVLWSVIKRRDWKFFENLLAKEGSKGSQPTPRKGDGPAPFLRPISRAPSLKSISSNNSNNNNHGGGSATSHGVSNPSSAGGGVTTSQRWQLQREQQAVDRYHHPPKETLTYGAWFEAALSLARDVNVKLCYIRTIDEHVQLSQQLLEATVTQTFRAEFWGAEQCGPLRDYRVMRQLKEGDCVWVLHRRGVTWLPAIIERVHYPYSAVVLPPDSGGDAISVGSGGVSLGSLASAGDIPHRLHQQYCTYDVYFPLNQEELNRSRMATISRQLLSLPSEQMAQEGTLPVRAFANERAVCAYAFDLLDVEASGVVDVDMLVSAMQSGAMSHIVSTSLVLASIFHGDVVIPQLHGGSSPMRSRSASGIHPSSGGTSSPAANQPIYVGRMKRASQTALILRKEKEKEKLRQKLREKLPWWQRTDTAPARPSFITVFCDTFADNDASSSSSLSPDPDDKDAQRGDLMLEDEDDLDDDNSRDSKSLSQKASPSISKIDFLEFCDAVQDVCRYDLPTLHHHMQQ